MLLPLFGRLSISYLYFPELEVDNDRQDETVDTELLLGAGASRLHASPTMPINLAHHQLREYGGVRNDVHDALIGTLLPFLLQWQKQVSATSPKYSTMVCFFF